LNTLLLFFQFVVHAGMVTAKRAYTNDCYADCTFVRQPIDFLRAYASPQRYDFYSARNSAGDGHYSVNIGR
jgi:hypothetical protein